MDLKQKIGSMIMVGFKGTKPEDEFVQKTRQDLKDGIINGVILFKYNVVNPEQLKTLTASLKDSKADALVAVDQEGGRVERMPESKGFVSVDSAKEMAEKNSLEEAYEKYYGMASTLKEAGVNFNFGPVVDIDMDPPCPVIGGYSRSYSNETETIVNYAESFISAHHKAEVLTCLKHFPGHGFALQDSHLGMVDVTDTYQEKELDPFYQLIDAGIADSIMTAHLVNRNEDSDGHPATLSPKILNNLLREKGYNGVIVTDDLFMGAIRKHYDFEETVIMAIKAGCDILLFSNNQILSDKDSKVELDSSLPSKIIDIVTQAIERGELSEERIEQSYERITSLTEKLAGLAFANAEQHDEL